MKVLIPRSFGEQCGQKPSTLVNINRTHKKEAKETGDCR